MQPEFSPTPRNGEQAPNTQESSYEIPEYGQSPELVQENKVERSQETSISERASELRQPSPTVHQDASQVALPYIQSDNDDNATVVSSNPDSANDDDVIEKEWVDRAKQILKQTKDDPYAREKAIGELQRDYLMKRYGKQLGSTAD